MKNIFLTSLIVIIGSVACIGITGLEKMSNLGIEKKYTIKENLSKSYNKYEINKEDVNEISFNGKKYKITNENVNITKLNRKIGDVLKSYTVDKDNNIIKQKGIWDIDILPTKEDQKIIYGLVYSINNVDNKEKIAVEVNAVYKVANIIDK